MSAKYELTGKIKEIGEIQTFSSGFQKRGFVVTDDDPKYPQHIPLEVVNERCAALDQYRVGDRVTVSFNLRGNEYNGRHYPSLAAWKIEREGQARPSDQNGAPPPSRTATADSLDEDDDQIPF